MVLRLSVNLLGTDVCEERTKGRKLKFCRKSQAGLVLSFDLLDEVEVLQGL